MMEILAMSSVELEADNGYSPNIIDSCGKEIIREERTLQIPHWGDGNETLAVANFSDESRTALLDVPAGD